MLEHSSMGEMTWKPPWSPSASVQQGQGAADKEEWDPGGTTVDQLTALYQAAFPATWLILLSPWRREKQRGCKDGGKLVVNLAGNPERRLDCAVLSCFNLLLPVERDPRMRNLSPP